MNFMLYGIDQPTAPIAPTNLCDVMLQLLLTRNEVDRPLLESRRQECEAQKLTNKCAPVESNGQYSPRTKICYQVCINCNEYHRDMSTAR
jgi:hypothetical protein